MGDQNVYPGSVDNSGLLRGKHEYYTHLFLHVLLYYVILYYIKQQQSSIPVAWSTLLHHSGSSMHSEEGRTKKSADIVFSSLSLFSEPGLHRNLFSMPVFLCVLCVARGCAVEALRFVVFHLFCHSPLTHHASPPHPTPPTHLQTGTCWPSRSTSSTSWTTSWSRRRAGTSSSAGTDCQMDRSQSHARYGSESSLIGRWVGGGGSHECSAG